VRARVPRCHEAESSSWAGKLSAGPVAAVLPGGPVPATPRSGQAAIGTDLVAMMDALDIEQAILAGHDWGGRAPCVVAALWPGRCRGLFSVNSYLIQDIAAATPIRPDLEAGLWYFYYFATERGRTGLAAHRREIADVIWRRNSPR
jgi:pimeloyl-ACP methyl ester carboxylesterase